MEKNYEYNKELLISYMDSLMEKYDSLGNEPFSNKARLALRNELENVRSLLAEAEMSSSLSYS